jgi:hypothetical protein
MAQALNEPRHGRLRPGSCRLCRAFDCESPAELAPGVVRLLDAFPVVPGHELMLTTQHAGSIAMAARSGLDLERLQAELLPDDAAPRLLLEHGVPSARPRSECIDHAHIHMLPGVAASLDTLLSAPSFAFARAASLNSVDLQHLDSAVGNAEYVWICDSSGDSVVVEVSASMAVPSQLARRAVAETLGLRGWDWRRSLALRGALPTSRLGSRFDREFCAS